MTGEAVKSSTNVSSIGIDTAIDERVRPCSGISYHKPLSVLCRRCVLAASIEIYPSASTKPLILSCCRLIADILIFASPSNASPSKNLSYGASA